MQVTGRDASGAAHRKGGVGEVAAIAGLGLDGLYCALGSIGVIFPFPFITCVFEEGLNLLDLSCTLGQLGECGITGSQHLGGFCVAVVHLAQIIRTPCAYLFGQDGIVLEIMECAKERSAVICPDDIAYVFDPILERSVVGVGKGAVGSAAARLCSSSG